MARHKKAAVAKTTMKSNLDATRENVSAVFGKPSAPKTAHAAKDSIAKSHAKLEADMKTALDDKAKAPEPFSDTDTDQQKSDKVERASLPVVVEAKPEPDGPMSLADVNAILADNYPGFEPTNVRGDAAGLKFALPGGSSISVERSKVKKCANMEELRAYIESVK